MTAEKIRVYDSGRLVAFISENVIEAESGYSVEIVKADYSFLTNGDHITSGDAGRRKS